MVSIGNAVKRVFRHIDGSLPAQTGRYLIEARLMSFKSDLSRAQDDKCACFTGKSCFYNFYECYDVV